MQEVIIETFSQSATAANSWAKQRGIFQARTWAMIVVATIFAAQHLKDTYFFQDEWDGLNRALHLKPFTGMTSSINGHLMVLDYWIHRIQISIFGVDDHWFVILTMLATLVLLHCALIKLFRTLGLSDFSSLMAATLLTYMGSGWQDVIFVAQISPVLAVAVGLFAVTMTLDHRPSIRHTLIIGALLVASVVIDSGMATITIPAVCVILYFNWSPRFTLTSVPAVGLLIWWYATADLSPRFDSSITAKISFFFRLVSGGVGSLVGAGQVAGWFLISSSCLLLLLGVRQSIISRQQLVASLGFGGAWLTTTFLISFSRAGMPDFSLFESNRYAHNVALPFALAALPVFNTFLHSVAKHYRAAESTRIWRLMPLVLAMFVFSASYPNLDRYTTSFTSNNAETKHLVKQAARLISQGCPDARTLDLASRPVGRFSPQVTTQLVVDLMNRDALHIDRSIEPTKPVVDLMCP